MIPDREKVIKGLECCIGQFPGEDYCKTCAYQPYRFGKCKADAITDALALLKEQEAVVRCKDCRWGEPTKNYYGEDRIICGNDDTYIDRYITVPQDWFCADGERKPTQTNAKNNALDVR